MVSCFLIFIFFFFNDTATTEIYTLSLHDALPISRRRAVAAVVPSPSSQGRRAGDRSPGRPLGLLRAQPRCPGPDHGLRGGGAARQARRELPGGVLPLTVFCGPYIKIR